jgi:hypothetical protein
MAYTYKKLTDVELVESAVEPNLLIEDGGDIKKISASNIADPQVKADWEETDETSPAFIMNKPDLSEVGGGANVVTYTIDSGALMLDGVAVTAQTVRDEWNNGSILRIADANVLSGNSGNAGSVVGVYFDASSGHVNSATISYFSGSGATPLTLTI